MKSVKTERCLCISNTPFVGLIIIFVHFHFLLAGTHAQENQLMKNNRMFLSTSYYDIFEKNIPNTFLDKFVAFMNGMGDKVAAREVVLKLWLDRQPDNLTADLQDRDGIVLIHIPQLPSGIDGENDLAKLQKLIKLIFAGEMIAQNTNFFDTAEQTMKKLASIAPNLFGANSEKLFENKTHLQETILQHGNEFEALTNLFNSHLSQYRKQYGAVTQAQYISHVENEIIQLYPIFDLYVSDGQNMEEDQIKSVVPTRTEINADIERFVRETYKKLLSRFPSPNELDVWKIQFESNSKLEPSLLYFIIMTSDEYMNY